MSGTGNGSQRRQAESPTVKPSDVKRGQLLNRTSIMNAVSLQIYKSFFFFKTFLGGWMSRTTNGPRMVLEVLRTLGEFTLREAVCVEGRRRGREVTINNPIKVN